MATPKSDQIHCVSTCPTSRNRIARLSGFFVLLLTFSPKIWPQQSDASEIYSKASKSVLLILVKSTDGSFIAQGTGFLVEGNKIVTNKHVIQGGAPMVDLGGARIAASVQALDDLNDLAILTTAAEMSFPALDFSEKVPQPGSQVLAIGNPRGLEKSISTGIVSSIRTVGKRKLIQITTPVSPGSSGGPLFDTSGKVIGVVVSSIEDGQNLNFAIPASSVVALLRGKSDQNRDVPSLVTTIESLIRKRSTMQYSDEEGSPFRNNQDRISSVASELTANATKSDLAGLLQIADVLSWSPYRGDSDSAVLVAQKAALLFPVAENYLVLARSLNLKASYMFSAAEESDKQETLKNSEILARKALATAKSPTSEIHYWLGDTLEMQGRHAEAEIHLRKALDLPQGKPNATSKADIFRDLVAVSDGLNRRPDEIRWFELLVETGSANAYDWEKHARGLDNEKQYNKAGDSWWKAAEIGSDWTDWCEAAGSFSAPYGNEDKELFAARKCIASGAGIEKSEMRLSSAHALVAEVLNDRGVYEEALSHGKEATNLNLLNANGHDQQAVALIGLHRYQEAINAEKQAIRLSDGKYGLMHFHLGTAYFNVENWQFADESFERAAKIMPKSDDSAYNVAICLRRLNMFRDAAQWYEEVLRRNPARKDKQDILTEVQRLRKL